MLEFSFNQLIHWNYYIALENDLINISRFIEFSHKNEKTYSIELAHLLMAISSEIDVVMKLLCKLLDNQLNYKNINEYRKCIQNNCPDIINEEIIINRYNLKYKPWVNWLNNSNNNPDWWSSYNNVKHHRNEFYDQANLKNVINSIGALLITLLYFYKNKFNLAFNETTRKLIPESSLLLINNSNYYYDNLIIS